MNRDARLEQLERIVNKVVNAVDTEILKDDGKTVGMAIATMAINDGLYPTDRKAS